jgi:hypothetical protein
MVMSLETWLLIAIIVLLVAVLGIAIFGLLALPSRLDSLKLDLDSLKLDFVRRIDRWREFVFPYSDQMYYIIRRCEEEYKIQLTSYAKQMLIIPVDEKVQVGQSVDWNEVYASTRKLFDALLEDDSEASRSFRERRNSIGVIKAFHKRFCNIPPFCASTERESSRDR